MKLYDEIISSWLEIINEYSSQTRKLEIKDSEWPDIGKHNMILHDETAYELGGGANQFAAIGGTAITCKDEFVQENQILLIGSDLCELKEDSPYARISICKVDEKAMEEVGEGNSLYKAVKNIEYTKYHINPEGFMMKISSIQHREGARVSKDAIQKGISFSDIGSLMLKSFNKDSKVLATKIIFITAKDFPYEKFAESVKQSELITKTIDHIMSSAIMDCTSCSLQKVCDEVEGMRELHFKQNAT